MLIECGSVQGEQLELVLNTVASLTVSQRNNTTNLFVVILFPPS